MIDPLKQKQEFSAVNGIRFFAAFWVLLFHCSVHFGRLGPLKPIQPFIDQGVLAMTLFFTLSGFILSYRYRDFATQAAVQDYAAARIARLYPVYLFIGLITVSQLLSGKSQFFLGDESSKVGPIVFIIVVVGLFVFGLQAWFPSFFDLWNFGGSWSLSAEAFFYVLFPLLRRILATLSVKALRIVFFAIPLLVFYIFAAMIASRKPGESILLFYILPIFRLPEFIAGMAGYELFVVRCHNLPLLKFLALSLGILIVPAMYLTDFPGFIDYDFFAIIPFIGCFVFSIQIDPSPKLKQLLNYLGRISYCVYMAQFATIPILRELMSRLSVFELWMACIIFTLLLAIVTYHVVEVLAYKWTYDCAKKLLCRLAGYCQLMNASSAESRGDRRLG